MLQGQIDAGSQDGQRWYGLVGIARQSLTDRIALSGRVERFADPHQVIINTGAPDAFVGNGASLGVDVSLEGGVRWRSEVRQLYTTAPLFTESRSPLSSRRNRLLVTSLSVAF
jgi:hypothetical protein